MRCVLPFSLPFRFALAAALCCFAGSRASAAQDLTAYWAMNNSYDVTEPVGSSAHLTGGWLHVGGGGHLDFGTGTTVNAYNGAPAGSSVEFSDFIGIVAIGYLQMSGLDFTGHVNPTISFAFQKTDLVTFFSSFQLEYRDGGSWVTVANLLEQDYTTFQRYSYTFTSGILDGRSNVDLRIHFVEALDIAASAKFDNILITADAIPEPGSMVLLAGGVVLAGAAFAGRKR